VTGFKEKEKISKNQLRLALTQISR